MARQSPEGCLYKEERKAPQTLRRDEFESVLQAVGHFGNDARFKKFFEYFLLFPLVFLANAVLVDVKSRLMVFDGASEHLFHLFHHAGEMVGITLALIGFGEFLAFLGVFDKVFDALTERMR